MMGFASQLFNLMVTTMLVCVSGVLVVMLISSVVGEGESRVKRGYISGGLESRRDGYSRDSDERDSNNSQEGCVCGGDSQRSYSGSREFSSYGRSQRPWSLQRQGRTLRATASDVTPTAALAHKNTILT